jgi:hypothetical protein
MAKPEPTDSLPYRDTKPVGAADFYFAINSTFRFILGRKGIEGLRRYWSELGTAYYQPVGKAWKERGLSGVAAYWRAFLAAEPGAEGEVREGEDRVEIEVRVCPAIKHLREAGREIVPCFCQHCFYQGEALAARAGMAYRLHGGNGTCRHIIHQNGDEIAQQNLSEIREAS